MYLSYPLAGEQRRVLIEYSVARIDTMPKLGELLDRGDRAEAKRVWGELSDQLALLHELGVDLQAGPMTLTVPEDLLQRLLRVLVEQAELQQDDEADERSERAREWGRSDLLLQTGRSLLSAVADDCLQAGPRDQ